MWNGLNIAPMGHNPIVAPIVTALTGNWSGEGTVQYPTISTFRYRETTTVTARDDHPSLLVEQRTWKLTPEGEEPSHWETGLLRVRSDGTVMFNNSQGGRAESMTGTWQERSGEWVISLRSIGYAGDRRVLSSTREYSLSPERISYEMSLATTATHRMSLHLRAALTKDA